MHDADGCKYQNRSTPCLKSMRLRNDKVQSGVMISVRDRRDIRESQAYRIIGHSEAVIP